MSLDQIKQSVILGKMEAVRDLVASALELGIGPGEILDQALIAGMVEIGQRFKEEEIYLPEVLFSARAMKAGIEILEPVLVETRENTAGTIVLGSVKGDIHDIGKNLVAIMFKSHGFEVVDLGVDIPPEKFVAAIKEHRPLLLGMSALLGTTVGQLEKTIEVIKEAGFREQVKIMVGGAIVTESYAARIGADGYAADAVSAVEKARDLLG